MNDGWKTVKPESVRRQHKRLKKPGRVREMPLHRAGVGHRLNLAVLRAQGLGEAFPSSCERTESVRSNGATGREGSTPGGWATVSSEAMEGDIGESPGVLGSLRRSSWVAIVLP